jgi:chromosome segregation ATPase
MKSKLVLWGANAQDEKILIAVALRPEDNKIDIYTFPESVATEDFYQQMMKEWRDNDNFELPDPHTHVERELSMSESLLPEDLKVERDDVVSRAQTEWHFIVLSSKLHHSYEDQLAELKERVEQLENFDQGIWDNLKEFWDKLQEQVRDRNLFREHADALRDNTNSLFGKMKDLRSKMDDEFERVSKDVYDKFMSALEEVENKVESGARLPAVFDELKKLQRRFRDSKLTREHRSKVWEKLDAAFKEVKQKRFGTKTADEGSSALQRLQRRYDGLIAAIGKMEHSIRRDRNDLEFQEHKINTTDGQLEAQIRQAKILMIEERVRSKEEKLTEMNATKTELEKRLASLQEKEARRAAQEAVKEKIAEDIKTAAEAREEDSEKLEKAAEEIVEAKAKTAAPKAKEAAKKEESLLDAVGVTLGDSLEDVVDTIKAVAAVISDKIEDAIDDLKEDLEAEDEEPAKEETPVAGEVKAEEELVEETAAVENTDDEK